VPDRDYISRHVRAPWRPAARLWVLEGPTDLTVDKFRVVLAKALRDGGIAVDRAHIEAERAGAHLNPLAMERLVERLLIQQAALAPVRGQRLAVVDARQLDREERQLLDALTPDVQRYAAAILDGRRPRVRRRPRPDTRRVLETSVPIQLS
jgi:hypothetical protein